MKFRYDYLELAIPVQYRLVNKNMKLYFGAGPYISYAIGGKAKWENVTGQPGNEPRKQSIVFGDNGAKRLDAGLTILASAQIKERWLLSINYDQGILKTQNYSTTHSFSVGLTIGYIFK
jgi:hypothetical protein